MASHLLRGVVIEVFHEERAGTDEAHVALEDIPELGELIEARATKEPPVVCETLGVRKRFPSGPIASRMVRNLIISNGLPFRPGRVWRKTTGAPILALLDETDHGNDGTRHDQDDGRAGNINRAFYPFVSRLPLTRVITTCRYVSERLSEHPALLMPVRTSAR